MSKILLVEDNPDAVKRIIRYINKIFAELDVVSFPEAGEALQYAKANDISLFILDSLGMKQKLGLAQAIMEGQDILILDEPFNALDYKTYEDVKAIIRMLKAEGKTIFLTSHHYKDIEQLCDQVYSLEDCQLLPITEEISARYREMD
jgi:ABC-type multidrug transport system ATPase subunit